MSEREFTKRCPSCETVFVIESHQGNVTYCRECWKKFSKEKYRYPDAARRRYYKKRYGITPEEYDGMVDSQGGVCAICKRQPAKDKGMRLAVDHCHTTGKIRGLLCTGCNTGLGSFGDDTERMLEAIEYLNLHAHIR